MEHFKYLIVGGGMTADAAVRGIRSVDPSGKIGVISAETDPPYNRPPLTKGLWKGDSLEKIWRKTEDQNVVLHLGRTVRAIEPQNKQLLAADNNRYSWEKLLLATGGSPRKFPFENDQVIYFRTLQDYQRLRALTEKNERFAVIGGGFIGSELAASLTMNQKKVVMIFPGQSIGNRVYPAELSQFLSEYYRQKGVEVRGGEKVIGIEGRGKQMVVRTNGQEFVVDGVVAGLGIVPNRDLAEKAGLKIENGIVVDEFLRTSNPDI